MLIADRFDSPVGTPVERDGLEIPPGDFYNSNPFGNFYYLGPGKTNPAYHTGADLLLWPGGGKGQPIWAVANGVITFAMRVKNPDGAWSSWGNLIIEQCTLPDGSVVYVRYAHSAPMLVKPGDEVVRGQQLSSVSDAFGRFRAHLHLDLSPTTLLRDHPADWPGMNGAYLEQHYVDPIKFIREHREVNVVATLEQLKAVRAQAAGVVASLDTLIGTPDWTPTHTTNTPDSNLNVRSAPISGSVVVALRDKTPVRVVEAKTMPTGAIWDRIDRPAEGWVSDALLVKNP